MEDRGRRQQRRLAYYSTLWLWHFFPLTYEEKKKEKKYSEKWIQNEKKHTIFFLISVSFSRKRRKKYKLPFFLILLRSNWLINKKWKKKTNGLIITPKIDGSLCLLHFGALSPSISVSFYKYTPSNPHLSYIYIYWYMCIKIRQYSI